MKLLYVISPNYLNAIKSESDKYSFYIQGYQKLKDAEEGLIKRNIGDILGFLYFSDKLPKNLERLVNFIQTVDSFAPKGMIFLIASQTGGNFDYIKSKLRIENLSIKILSGWDIVTNETISVCFTPFVIANFNPYNEYKTHRTKSSFSYNKDLVSDNLKIENSFERKLLKAISPVKLQSNLETTLANDLILNEFSYTRDSYYKIRQIYIQAHFGDCTKLNELAANLTKVGSNPFITKSICNRVEKLAKSR